jgi:hypothetical protein
VRTVARADQILELIDCGNWRSASQNRENALLAMFESNNLPFFIEFRGRVFSREQSQHEARG